MENSMKAVKCYICGQLTKNFPTTRLLVCDFVEKKIASTLCHKCQERIAYQLAHYDEYIKWLDIRASSKGRYKCKVG